jgi:6-phosphofructokinase
MNAAIRAVIRTGQSRGINTWGVYQGYSGLIEGSARAM